MEIFDHCGVFARQCPEPFFAPGVRQTAAIEDESSAVAAVIIRQAAVEREADDVDDEIVGVGREALKSFRGQHAVEGFQQSGQRNRQPHVVQQPAEIFQGIRYALQEVHLALVESAESIGAQGLHDADVDVAVVVLEEGFGLDVNEVAQGGQIVIEQLLAELRGKICFGIVKQGSNVVLKSALAASLIVEEVRLASGQHDVAGLEIAVEEEIARGAQEKLRQA